jgi:hypothetical protein
MKRTFSFLPAFLPLFFIILSAAALRAQRLVVLGTVQDAGSPHIGCTKGCCKALFKKPDPGRKVVSLGLIDEKHGKAFLIEATPDITAQVEALKARALFPGEGVPDGILLTHAHIGHYSGLMYLGREALGARQVPVFAMPRMRTYLENNGPWSQLAGLGNIALQNLKDGEELILTPDLKVTPFLVPHRDEFSETVGFRIAGKFRTAIFLPDIDKWEKWAATSRRYYLRWITPFSTLPFSMLQKSATAISGRFPILLSSKVWHCSRACRPRKRRRSVSSILTIRTHCSMHAAGHPGRCAKWGLRYPGYTMR